MKKVTFISDKIKNNNFSYTGKGGFEAVVINYKKDILIWLEDLVPLQKQMEILYEKDNIEFQKRNYTRILTKFFPDEYKEFVNVNILLRDAKFIKDGFEKQNDVSNLYDILVTNNYLKYPGRSEKYVEFNIFEEFIKVYIHDLNIQYISQYKQKEESIALEEEIQNVETIEIIDEVIYKEPVVEVKKDKEENYWTNLLLGKK